MLLEEGAIFIADVHYPNHGEEVIKLLKNIQNDNIKTSQLFLMGDIFDLLFKGEFVYEYNRELIELINNLSKSISIIYLEGNHDFNLSSIFLDVEVVPRYKQPYIIKNNNGHTFCLSHGDRFDTGIFYNIYTSIIRNSLIINILTPFERWISSNILKRLSKKDICKEFKLFKDKVAKIIPYYPKNCFIIEGHFHQDYKDSRYIALPSFACAKRFGVYKDGEINIVDIRDFL